MEGITEDINNLVQSLIRFRIPRFTLALDEYDYYLWRKEYGSVAMQYLLKPEITKGTMCLLGIPSANTNNFKFGVLEVVKIGT